MGKTKKPKTTLESLIKYAKENHRFLPGDKVWAIGKNNVPVKETIKVWVLRANKEIIELVYTTEENDQVHPLFNTKKEANEAVKKLTEMRTNSFFEQMGYEIKYLYKKFGEKKTVEIFQNAIKQGAKELKSEVNMAKKVNAKKK